MKLREAVAKKLGLAADAEFADGTVRVETVNGRQRPLYR